jgi:hypothetical protein
MKVIIYVTFFNAIHNKKKKKKICNICNKGVAAQR